MEKMKMELHCHTDFSDRRGLIVVEKLFDYAVKHQLKAIAITDCSNVQAFPLANQFRKELAEDGLNAPKVIFGMEGSLVDKADGSGYPILIYAKNETGIRNLYRMISAIVKPGRQSPLRITGPILEEYREGLLVGAVCDGGEISDALRSNASGENLRKILSRYDFLEITPYRDDVNPKLFALGSKAGLPVILTSDCYHLYREDHLCYEMLRWSRNRNQPIAKDSFRPAHMKDEKEFTNAVERIAEDIADLTVKEIMDYLAESGERIVNQIDDFSPLRDGRHLPVYPDAEEALKRGCYVYAAELYGTELPDEVRVRLEMELTAICENGYAGIYMLWANLADSQVRDENPYSYGNAAGASLVAYLMGITKVNPLKAHYRCANCHYTQFDIKERKVPGMVGIDLEDRLCPVCGQKLVKDGFDLSPETFMGKELNREPHINLSVTQDGWKKIQRLYAPSALGVGDVFRAGTVCGINETYAKDFIIEPYYKVHGLPLPESSKVEEMAKKMSGVKIMDGIHPGRIFVVPEGEETTTFTPILLRPDTDKNTCHFSYHRLDDTLLSLDIYRDPNLDLLKQLWDLTGVAPDDIPFEDEELMADLKAPRQEPIFTNFTQFIRMFGLKHGTDTWRGNAEVLIEKNVAGSDEVIASRDDVLQYLLAHNVEHDLACRIMEAVSKGHGLPKIFHSGMQERGIPDWFIGSCEKIHYLYPKANEVEYAIRIWRRNWYRVHYPEEFQSICGWL